MNRQKFLEYIKGFGFISTKRFNGSHEIFKSTKYPFNFAVPSGEKEIRKGIYWSFQKEVRNYEGIQK